MPCWARIFPRRRPGICNCAGLAYAEDAVAERHLREAEALAPDHAAVLIGLYRFYFYKGRLRKRWRLRGFVLRRQRAKTA